MAEEETTTAAVESNETETAGTAKEAGEEGGKGWSSATKARFDEINTRMKKAEERSEKAELRSERLEGQLEAAIEVKATEKDEPLKAPPGMSQDEQVEWLMENHTERWFNKKFGMTPAEAKVALQATAETSKTAQRTRWEALCDKAGLDPNDKKIARYARGISSEDGATIESIVKECSAVFGKKPTDDRKQPNSMELGSETAEMIAEEELPFTTRDATKAAREGRKAPNLDASEILDRAAARRRANA